MEKVNTGIRPASRPYTDLPIRCAAFFQIWTNEAWSDCTGLPSLPSHHFPWRVDYVKQLLSSFIISKPSFSFSPETLCSYIISPSIFQETEKEIQIFHLLLLKKMLIVSFVGWIYNSPPFCKENHINYTLHMFYKMIQKLSKHTMKNKTKKPSWWDIHHTWFHVFLCNSVKLTELARNWVAK